MMGSPPTVGNYASIAKGVVQSDKNQSKLEDLSKKKSSREGACLLNPNWELGPQKRYLIAEGSASYSMFRNSRNSK